jgi:hypothetical protein
VQNSFIRARRGDYLLNAWREMILAYWADEKGTRLDYLVHQLMFKSLVQNDKIAAAEFAKMPHINLKATHNLWFVYKDKKFDKKIFLKTAEQSWVHKTTYRGNENIIPGSFADFIINGKTNA